MIGSPPRRDPRPDPGYLPGSGRPVVTPASATPAARARPTRRDRARQWAVVALAGLTALQVLAALAFLLVLTTVPPELNMQTGPRSPSVGPTLSEPQHTGPPPTGSAPTGSAPTGSAPTGSAPNGVAPAQPAPPLRATVLDVPKLGIRQNLLELGVDAAGVLEPPVEPDVAGWFTGAAAPGERGPTVIAGHVDSRTGPGVFYALKDMARGDLVDVGRSDGRTATYRVTELVTVDKDRFPTQRVYGPTAGPELHLITCGGSFDRVSGHYLRNVVISAVLVQLR